MLISPKAPPPSETKKLNFLTAQLSQEKTKFITRQIPN
jgi:hypothetical protein